MKKLLLIFLVLALLLGTLGCTPGSVEQTVPTTGTQPPAPTVDPMKEAYKKDRAAFVRFSRSTEPRECYVPVEEIRGYESQFPDCIGTWYRDQLSDEDRLIYNSYLYALENRLIHFELYVADNDRDFSYIREALSLDSPFLEQNYSHYEHLWKNPTNYVGESITGSMEQFTESRWEMKMQALEDCRRIVAAIPPECDTQVKKMEYLYDYVCEHVEYVPYESYADESYFYDAVCKGQTVCDGYSNMLSLLFRLVGVECYEAMGSDSEEADGHTWVVAKLDGQFYNFDPTFEDNDDITTDNRRYFGFSDDLIAVKNVDLEEIRPKCTDTSRDFYYADLIVSDITSSQELRKIAQLVQQRRAQGETTTLIAVRSAVDEEAFETFGKQFFWYTTQIKGINTRLNQLHGSALLEITAD